MDFQNKPVIFTHRLCLRHICDADQDSMIALLTNAEIGKTYMLPVLSSREEELRMFARFKELSVSADHFVYGICLGNKLIGFLNDVQTNGSEMELGYVIHPDHHNKGYATEALDAAMQVLFSMGCSAVIAGAFAENPASMRVMEKCGMTRTAQEEIISYQGEDHRCIYYRKERPL